MFRDEPTISCEQNCCEYFYVSSTKACHALQVYPVILNAALSRSFIEHASALAHIGMFIYG